MAFDLQTPVFDQYNVPTTATSSDVLIWYNQVKQELNAIRPTHLYKSDTKIEKFDKLARTPLSFLGNIFAFWYLYPKNMQTLPYYDRFPVVMPLQTYDDGFLGVNWHYIQPLHRIILLERMLTLKVGNNLGDITRIRLNYKGLKVSSKYKYFRPTVRKYLKKNIKRQALLPIESKDWMTAILLPVQWFKKSKEQTVWKDSRRTF